MMPRKCRKPGKTRAKLSELLQSQIPGLIIEPDALLPEHPALIKWWGVAVWTGDGKLDGMDLHVFSWDTMTNCVRYGIETKEESPYWIEVFSLAPPSS